MNYSDLKRFFDSQIDALTFEKLIHDEVQMYKHNLLTKKYAPVTVNYIENEYMTINAFHLKKICDAFLNGYISDYEMFYVADGIQLCHHFIFENDEVEDMFYLITDPEINGEINKEYITNLLSYI